MRFYPDGPSLPDALLERCDADRVVFLCGAGVSVPSGMPSFVELTKYVISFFDPPIDSDIMKAFQPWLDDEAAAKARISDKAAANNQLEDKASVNVPLDQIFNLLHQEYGKEDVNRLVAQRLREVPEREEFGRAHGLIKRISSSRSRAPKIVTTNFDLLFETGSSSEQLKVHTAPAFPDLNFGSDIGGITYLHGRLDDTASATHSYVLSSADFGRAYLSEGWATNFIRHLLERYTVVLVGYQAEDPPVKYLLQGLNHDGKFDRSKLYAFDRGRPEEIEAKWRDRGVSAIAYAKHEDLWKTMASWAERADDPRRWRAAVIATTQHDPKCLLPHERGQVAHVLRSVQGARLFAEANPLPHPEWVCVLDANVRSAKPSSGHGDDAEHFSPQAAYGLDDDVADISDDERRQRASSDGLLVWHDGDDSPQEVYRLWGASEKTSKRLTHLINWMGNSVDSPVLAWWAIRYIGLHPLLLERLERQVLQSQRLDKRGRHIWHLIFEALRDTRNHPWSGKWFDWERRLAAEGWSGSILRELRSVVAPRLSIKPPYGLAQSKPPAENWENIQFRDLGEFKVIFLERHNQVTDVPDSLLPQVVGVLEEQLLIASGLLSDIGTIYFNTPTCYPDRDDEGMDDILHAREMMKWFIQLFDRMAKKWPQFAAARAATWPETDQYFFRKLKLYALNNSAVFSPPKAAHAVLSLDQQAFWDKQVARELLFLLVDRWGNFSALSRRKLISRILTGPSQPVDGDSEQFPGWRDELAARYARYLELQGCALTAEHGVLLARMIGSIPEWSDGWATSLITVRGSSAKWYGTDESPDLLLSLPVSQIIAKAEEEGKRDFDSMTEKNPFLGLVKTDTRRALSALTLDGRHGKFPPAYWASLINEFPPDASSRLWRVFVNRVARLPHDVIVGLRQTLGRWLVKNLVAILDVDGKLGWAIYDRIVDALFAAGADATRSYLNDAQHRSAVTRRSRRTFDHATASAVGDCAAALFSTVPRGSELANTLILEYTKLRAIRLFDAPGEGGDHAVSITCSQLNRLMFVDPVWTTERLVPMLAFDHPSAEPAWNGFLHCGQSPWPPLAAVIKPQLLHLFPWVESFPWPSELPAMAAAWLGTLRVFHRHEPGGFSRGEMRGALRAMSDETRNHFISRLSQLGQRESDGWVKYVIPLVDEDWPRERRYRTSASVRAWISLLGGTGNSFAAVYEVVKRFLVEVETPDHFLGRFSRDNDSITARFPLTTLDLMDRATPQVLMQSPQELPKVLVLIAEAEPALQSDSRFLRLIELVERS